MNKEDAKKLARSFLSKTIKLEFCAHPPKEIYGINQEGEFLFTIQLNGESSIGSSPYIAVSRETAFVRYVGHFGE